jgi:hypothetical protein
MRIIPNLDHTRVIVDGIPITIEKSASNEIQKAVFETRTATFTVELGKIFYTDDTVSDNLSKKRRWHRAGFIEPVKIKGLEKPTVSLWYVRSHRLTLAYYILGPMLITKDFNIKAKLGVGLCMANIYDSVDLDGKRMDGKIYVLYRCAMHDIEVYSLLSTNDNKLNLTKHPLFVERFAVDEYHDMYVFDIPEEYQRVYSLYKQGAWSKFPDEFRMKVYKWSPNKDKETIWKWRFEKAPILRQKLMRQLDIEISKDAELCQAPNGDETFTEKAQMPNPKHINPKKNVTISTERSDGPDDQVD